MRYSDEVHNFISQNVKGNTINDLVKMVNEKYGTQFTKSKMSNYKTNHKLKSGTPVGVTKGMPTDLYPKRVRDFIENNYNGNGPKEMSELLNKTFGTNYTKMQLKSYYGNHKINSGQTGCFPKGNVPVNKGKKGYHAPGCEKGWFEKGSIPLNHKPIGSERIDVDGYSLVKVEEPNKWEFKHKLIWTNHNGEIPKDHVILFGDGNRQNFDIDNLLLVSRQQLLILNRHKLIQKDTDLTRTGIIIADIYQKMAKRKVKE